MQELAGRLTVVDPDASESVKVITFFDSLVAGGAGVESVVRAMVMLSGTAAGATVRDRVIRIDAEGRRSSASDPGTWPSLTSNDVCAWIERHGAPHANDAMILDRATLALTIIDARRRPEASAIEIVLDPASSPHERAAALNRLRLNDGPLRVVATPAGRPADDAATAVVAVTEGLVRAAIGCALPVDGPAGTALAPDASSLPQAWADARIALRLVDETHPVVDADSYGALMILARAHDPTAPQHPDVTALLQLDSRSLAMLDALAESDSVRAAAASLKLHHSSLQSRHETWTRQLGYDPFTPHGRARYEAARILSRLT